MAFSKPLIAFYGATGGSTLSAIVPALKAGYDCTALARTPSKLTSLLLERGVSESTLSAHLTISQGDVLNPDQVGGPLSLNDRPATMIVSGIGIVNLSEAMSPITLCGDACTNIVTALTKLNPPTKPLFVVLSTTGISDGPNDVPLGFGFMYHVLLKNPHVDKRRMEHVVQEAASEGKTRGFVIMRASLLMNGKAIGPEKIKYGFEEKPAKGYTINRDDVGLWVYENVIKEDGGRFVNKKVTVTS